MWIDVMHTQHTVTLGDCTNKFDYIWRICKLPFSYVCMNIYLSLILMLSIWINKLLLSNLLFPSPSLNRGDSCWFLAFMGTQIHEWTCITYATHTHTFCTIKFSITRFHFTWNDVWRFIAHNTFTGRHNKCSLNKKGLCRKWQMYDKERSDYPKYIYIYTYEYILEKKTRTHTHKRVQRNRAREGKSASDRVNE